MASFGSRQIPTVFFKKLEDLLDLHSQMIKQLARVGKIGRMLVVATEIIVGLGCEHPQTTVR